MMVSCDLYLRLSDGRLEEALSGREAKLRAEAARLGWTVRSVVTENDINEDGTIKPASAFKRKKVITPSGRTEMRVIRPAWRRIIEDLADGRIQAVLAEDLDRACRDPRDLEDLIDAVEASRATARSLSGSLTLTRGGTDTEITTARLMVTVKNAESRDKARRVSDGRSRWAGLSYGGGRRPFGYSVVADTEKYHKMLAPVAAEADAIRRAYADMLDRGISQRAIARQWNEAGLPSVTGARWTSSLVRAVLTKPSLCALTVKRAEDGGEDGETAKTLVAACWEPIVTRERWEALCDAVSDPSRTTTTGNEPKWLVSLHALCGVCNDGTTVRATGARRAAADGSPGKAYCCAEYGHLRRDLDKVDALIASEIVARLSQDDAGELLKPPVRTGIDAAALRAEAKQLAERKRSQVRMHSEGIIDDADLAAGAKSIRDRLARITAQLATADIPDPLAEFRDRPAETVWHSLSMARRRQVVKRLMPAIVIMPASRRGRGSWNPDEIVISWTPEAA